MSESLRSVIIQELRTRFPAINWKLGSLVRELIVEPLARLGDILDSSIQKAESRLDLSSIYKDPIRHKEAIDTWMSVLNITTPENKSSIGKIVILSESGESMTVLAGTVFTWGDNLSLVATESTYWGDNGKPFIKYGEGAYAAEIDVMSVADYGVSLSQGSPINWDGAPAHVYDIYTSTAITGGRAELSYQEKANLIKSAMSTKSFVGEDCISNAIQRAFPEEVVDAVVLPKRNADRPYETIISIKPVNPPGAFYISSVVCKDTEDAPFVLIRDPGVTSVVAVKDSQGIPCPVSRVKYTKNPNTMITEITVYILGVKVGDSVSVECSGFDVIDRCASWLNQDVNGLPFKYSVVAPAVTVISVYIPTTADLTLDVKTAIQTYINTKPLDTSLSDNEIIDILSSYGITTTGSIIYSASTLNNVGSNAVSTSVGGINIAGNSWATGRATAMYTFVDKINTND